MADINQTSNPPYAAPFNIAQTFKIDPSNQPDQIPISSVDLRFMYKPTATENQSGINNPGVTVYLAQTEFGIPKITQDTFNNAARAEYNEIHTSSDGSVSTRFYFSNPVMVDTNDTHSLLISYDGSETFTPWTAIKDNVLPGTRVVYDGPASSFQGQYFEFSSGAGDPQSNTDNNLSPPDYATALRPLNSTVLSFAINSHRYFIDGVPVAQSNAVSNTIMVHHGVPIQGWDSVNDHVTFIFPSFNVEGISFNLDTSTVNAFVGAQRVFQNTVFWPGTYANGSSSIGVSTNNSVIITANTKYPNGANFIWNNVFNSYSGLKFVTLFDTTFVNCRKVVSIISNTVIQVDEPVTFTNAAAKFMISPVAIIDSIYSSSPLGRKDHFMWLTQSNANSTVRFVNNAIEAIAISAGGSGYSNSDAIYVTGFESVVGKVTGGYVAVANLVTNSTGGVTSLYMSNLGSGFVNSSSIILRVANSTNIGNSTANTSGGTGATFTYTIGATLRTELTTNLFKNCVVGNFGLNDVIPFAEIFSPTGTTFESTFMSQYYVVPDANTSDLNAYYVNATPFSTSVHMNQHNLFSGNQIPCFLSYSNEFVTHYSNGSINDKVNALSFTSNNVILQINTVSNSDYTCVIVNSAPVIEFGRYIINNDYTNEHTNSGNSWAKHITTHVSFARLAEDIRVYLTAYKPANTDFQVYARIQNNNDSEPFDDEDWTRLQLIDGIGIMSSINDPNDYIELTYGFQSYPNTQFTLAGSVTTTNNSTTVTGVGTTLSSNLAVGDLIRIYDPLFPNTNFLVTTVVTVPNTTSMTIGEAITTDLNTALVAPGLKVEKLAYPHQAFNNPLQENVVRYYNSSMMKFDGYTDVQLKVVLLSSRQQNIPRIRDLRLIGVSA